MEDIGRYPAGIHLAYYPLLSQEGISAQVFKRYKSMAPVVISGEETLWADNSVSIETISLPPTSRNMHEI